MSIKTKMPIKVDFSNFNESLKVWNPREPLTDCIFLMRLANAINAMRKGGKIPINNRGLSACIRPTSPLLVC